MKKLIVLIILSIFVLCSVSGYAAEAKKLRASQGIENVFYGFSEIPDNLKQNNEKAFPHITAKENDGFGRGVARTIGGLFQLLTPWAND